MTAQAVELPAPPTTLLDCCADEPFVFCLDGGGGDSWGDGTARFGFRPRARLRIDAHGRAEVAAAGRPVQVWKGDPFDLLARFCDQYEAGGGVVAALSYELRCFVESLPLRQDLHPALLLHAASYEWALVYSYADDSYKLESTRLTAPDLRSIADHLVERLARPRPPVSPPSACARPLWSKTQYEAKVRAALDYIAAGDIYQVNLAQPFVTTDRVRPTALFAALRRRHPMPFAAYVDLDGTALVSDSPECFLRVRDRQIATFPIKGTRPRAADGDADRRLACALLDDAKEQAEHVMIVDLERNDLGRVCELGSVRVDELGRVHTFPGLHHLVSAVRGQLRAEAGLADVLRATFPGGSITGAPKVRAMQIIDELEASSRGFYTGAIGYLRRRSEAVFNLAIRTAVVTDNGTTYHAGGGIVADSVPQREYDETLLKAEPFFTALAEMAR